MSIRKIEKKNNKKAKCLHSQNIQDFHKFAKLNYK